MNWNQSANVTVTNVAAVNTTWAQDAPLTVDWLTWEDGTWTMNQPLTILGGYTAQGVQVVQNAAWSVPGNSLVVSNWHWSMDVNQVWSNVSNSSKIISFK